MTFRKKICGYMYEPKKKRKHDTEEQDINTVDGPSVAVTNSGLFAPRLIRPLAFSPPGLFVLWLICPLAYSSSGFFAPGLFVLWLIRPLAYSSSGVCVLRLIVISIIIIVLLNPHKIEEIKMYI